MRIYLVGGAVRDGLLGRPVKERDYVVVGATPQEMLDRGFRLVGKDFPVFLHPRTHEEYALARTERRAPAGQPKFVVHADPSVTLKQDLERRDLTINALAKDEQGGIIDYYGGRADLDARILRHVSPAFSEDPVRVLRVARFAARYQQLEFRVADETFDLMRDMVQRGKLDDLVPERVWQELAKALTEPLPSCFFVVLRQCGALERLFPEIEALFGVPQPAHAHPEIDTGVHTMMVLDLAAGLSPDPEVRFAALTHDLGKGTTPSDVLPRHIGHETRGLALIHALCERIRAPRRFRDLALLVARYHGQVHKVAELRPATVLGIFEGTDALRRPERFRQLLLACEADYRGREGYQDLDYPQARQLSSILDAVLRLDEGGIAAAEPDPGRVPERIRQARIEVIRGTLATPL